MTTPGIQIGERFLALKDMNVQAGRAAGGFAALGIGQGDSVAIMLRNDIPFMLASAGASRLGAYPVPINWHLKEEEVNYILKDCEAKALVIHADLLSGIGGAVPPGVTVFSVPTPPEVAAAYGITEAQQQHGVDAVVWEEWLEQQPPKEEQPE